MSPPSLEQVLEKKPVPGNLADFVGLELTPHEGFVLSRIDGQTSAALIAQLVGMEPAPLAALLRRLERQGVICWLGEEGAFLDAQETSAFESTHEGLPRDKQGKPSDCDLTAEERAGIEAAGNLAAIGDHWGLLGLQASASNADVKRAYFQASKRYHPDRYFGRQLGPYREVLQQIFQASRAAYESLRCVSGRAAYQERTAPPPLAPPAPAGTGEKTAALDPRLQARRREIEAAREARAQEAVGAQDERKLQAHQMFEQGERHYHKGDVAEAARFYALAAAYDPANETYRSRRREVGAAREGKRLQQLVETAQMHEVSGRTLEAARDFARAFELDRACLNNAVQASKLFLESESWDLAKRYLDRALDLAKRDKDVRVLAACYYEKRGDVAAAASHLEIAASLDDGDARVAKMLDRLYRKLASEKRTSP